MTRWASLGLMMAASLAAAGCTEQTAPNAEVPKAGPAAKPAPDAGPAPAGQSEPGAGKPVDTSPAPAADDSAPAAGESKPAADAPQTSTESPGDIQLVAFKEEAPAKKEEKSDVQVKIIDWKKTEELIASHKGKVVVVDMWSLSCDPCRKEFPNLVKLHNDRKAEVACISVSTDYAGIKSKPPEFYKPKVLEFLTQQKATFENVLCSVDSETLFDQLSLASIPAVYVYGKDGKMVQRFAGEEVHYDKEVVPLVEKLLAE
jgi:thiol-disulfide isomerase/thioredoxin